MDSLFPKWLLEIGNWVANTFLGKWLEWFFNEIGHPVPSEYRGLILLFLVSNIVFHIAWLSIWAFLWISRGWRSISPEATGRWATTEEIRKLFTLLSPPQYFIVTRLPLILGIGIFAYIIFEPSSTISVYYPLLLTATGGVLYVNTSYHDYRKKAMPYPLGKHNALKPCLIGGKRKSLLLGTVKDQRQEHVLIIGPTGTGKTSAYFIPPLLDDAIGNCSAVVVEAKVTGDDKDDMLKIVGPTWFSNGKKVLVFDPWSSGPTLHFNPLLNLKPDIDDSETREYVDDIVDAIYRTSAEMIGSPSADGAYHEGNEKALLRGLIFLTLFQPNSQRNFTAIRHVVGSGVEEVTAFISRSAGPANMTVTEYIRRELLWFTSQELRLDRKADTLRGIARKLDIFTHPKIKSCTVNNNLDLELVFKEPCLLVIKAPMNVVGANVLASIISRLLMLKSHKKITYGAGEDFKVWFYLDELPTLCLPELSKFVATARSAGVGVIGAVQDKADLFSSVMVSKGTNSTESLLTNFKTKIILPGCGPDMAKYLSEAWGLQSTDQTTFSRGVFDVLNFRYIKTQKTSPLISRDDVYKMQKNQAIIDVAHTRPFIVKQVRWYQSWKYKSMVKKNAKIEGWHYQPDMAEEIKYEPPYIPSFNVTDLNKVKRRTVDLSEILGEGRPIILNQDSADTDRHAMPKKNKSKRFNDPVIEYAFEPEQDNIQDKDI